MPLPSPSVMRIGELTVADGYHGRRAENGRADRAYQCDQQ